MSTFIRDPLTKMVINTDDSHYQAIIHARTAEKEAEAIRKKLDDMDKLINTVNEMKQQLEELLAGNKNVKISS